MLFQECSLLILSLPKTKIHKPINAKEPITAVMGRSVPSLKTPTSAAVRAPIPICKAPIKADALPASLENGTNDKADELGKLKP